MRSFRRIAAATVSCGLALTLAGCAGDQHRGFGAGHVRAGVPEGGTVVSARGAQGSVDVDATYAATSEPARTPAGASGYTYLVSSIVAETPMGFGIWVSPKAPHHWTIAKNAAATVKTLQSLGIQARYRGYGSPSPVEGVVRVLEGKKGCGSNSSTVGMTYTYWNTLPSGKAYVTHADVYLCPRLFKLGTWATTATVGHEIGHAMGLGHVPYRYMGGYQLMNPVVRPGVVKYQAGDRRGLKKLAQATASIKSQIPPVGNLDGSHFDSDGNIDFTGWALLKFDKAGPVTVTLTDNGTTVQTSGTPILRSDVNKTQDPGSTRTHGYSFAVPWNGGSHQYCVLASSTDQPSASTKLGCVTWHD